MARSPSRSPSALACLGLALAVVPLSAQDGGGGVAARYAELAYRSIGPTRGGRSTAVTGVSRQPGTFYFGASGGGVWKTTDYGDSWRNVSDGFLTSPSIGAIAIAPSNPERVYVGTGSDGIRSNVIRGDGVYRSDDGGATWRHLGLPRAGLIGAVEVHPRNPDVVYVAAIGQPFGPNPERGVYRSRDGGATWEQVLFVSDSTGAVDLEFAPDDPETIYASMWRTERKPWTIISGAREGGVYKSTDGGTTWTKLGGGLPTGLVGKSDLAVSAADPNRLYVLIEALPGGGLYRSDDRGATFQLVSTQSGILDRPFYYTNITADPNDADAVWAMATGFWQSTDGGHTFRRRSTPHGDNHDLWIDPRDSRVMIQSNDGGANVTRDGGVNWSTQLNQPTAELYQVAVDDQFPYWLYAGQQDNGSAIRVPSLPPYGSPIGVMGFYRSAGGCETGPAVPKPGDPAIIYSNCKGQFSRYNARTGQEQNYWVGGENLYGSNPSELLYRFQRVVPIHVSPHDPGTIYHGSQYLHRTRDEGVTWERISPDLTAFDPKRQVVSGTPITRDVTGEEHYSTLYTVAESPVEAGVIWTGANDGPVSVTRDAGRTWHRVTPPGLAPEGRVQTVAPSPHRGGKAYVAILRYLLDDWAPYAYRTTDYGRTWTRITDGIPAEDPVHVVREDPRREGLLYAGTDHGVYVSWDDGAHWNPMQLNLPVTPVTDIGFARNDLVLSTMGRGFWILDDRLMLTRDEVVAGVSTPTILSPSTAVRTRYRTGGGAVGENDDDAPSFPPPGTWIDYLVPAGFQGDLTLEIHDGRGALVRSYSSTGGTGGLSTRPGHHRLRWDLAYAPAGGGGGGGFGRSRSGPLVVPGSFDLVLQSSAGSVTRARLAVELDPRVVADGVTNDALQEQLDLERQVLDLSTRARSLANRVRTLRRERPNDGKIADAERELITASGPYQKPMLVDQIQYLYGMISGADQRPGRDAHIRLGQLEEWYGRVVRMVPSQ